MGLTSLPKLGEGLSDDAFYSDFAGLIKNKKMFELASNIILH